MKQKTCKNGTWARKEKNSKTRPKLCYDSQNTGDITDSKLKTMILIINFHNKLYKIMNGNDLI